MSTSNIAKVVQWNEQKGFGFAEANGTRYFVHITALGHTSRKPKAGDTISVELFGNSEKGPRIEKGILEGVEIMQPTRKRPTIRHHKPNSFIALWNAVAAKNNRAIRKVALLICIVAVLCLVIGKCTSSSPNNSFVPEHETSTLSSTAKANSQYTSKIEVANYICKNGRLPDNYVNKREGKRLYEQKTGRDFVKWNFNPWTTIGYMIGGDYYNNGEGLLPSGDWREADVDYLTSSRGSKRLVYASGCRIYYTENHYRSFTKIEF
ncbi:MAG: hypothetical protein HUK19_07150 [Fibrobacter sp.]|nr:hypothetical protein [Fibrobacter sp.]